MCASKLVLVLPAYNEGKNLRAVIDNLERVCRVLEHLGYDRFYVVVNDGSTDSTAAILRDLQVDSPIEVITHERNQGLGVTIRDGLLSAAQVASDDDIIVTMDADNTHPAGLLHSMVLRIQEGNDVVIASRYRYGARVVGLRWNRRLLSVGARLLFQLMHPIPGVRDYTSAYRAYRAVAIKTAFKTYGDKLVEQKGFQCMAEILIRMARLGFIMCEVPMVLRYDLKGGASKMRVVATVVQTLKLMLVRRLRW